MKFVRVSLLFLLLGVILASCKQELDRTFTGKNELKIEAKEIQMQVGGRDSLIVRLFRTTQLDQAQTVAVSIDEDTNSYLEYPRAVTFPQDSISLEFVVKLRKEVELAKKESYTISFSSLIEEGNLHAYSLSIVVLPDVLPVEMTEEDLDIVAYWESKGYPLGKLLGVKVPVKTRVSWPADGVIQGFEDAGIRNYEGVTMLALGSYCNKDSIVIRFTTNALGMTEFFYWALRAHTVCNYEFWYHPMSGPNFFKIRDLIEWRDNSPETFDCMLDSVRISPMNSEGISEIHMLKWSQRSDFDRYNVPFDFYYTAWERLKVLLEQRDPTAIECQTTNSSPYPWMFVNTGNFRYKPVGWTGDYVSEYDMVSPQRPQHAWINWKTGELYFDYQTDVDCGAGYIDCIATLQIPNW